MLEDRRRSKIYETKSLKEDEEEEEIKSVFQEQKLQGCKHSHESKHRIYE